ncbi:MAG: FHA domain-containing protein [Thermomicrobiales bacterium]|nr:FHA domain-containing protein [Thermomicrobiales bacterium]MCA9878623.1 FHA domain-containing protein [Thermomicrobiales bacterium]
MDRLEQALARAIDGSIAATFRLKVRPADIGRRLELALLDSRRTSVGRVIGANEFVVSLHPADHAEFASWEIALARELENWLGEIAFRHGVTLLALPKVVLRSDAEVGRRMMRVAAAFNEAPATGANVSGPVVRLVPLSRPGNVIVLTDCDTSVGRAPGNDLVISAAEISREHARLRRVGGELEVQDLGSRNGTWVNGTRVTMQRARSGDEIAFSTLSFRLDLP